MNRIDEGTVSKLRKEFSGQVILEGESRYDEARKVFNAMIDRRPRVIAQCAGLDDVKRAIKFGRDHDLEIAVRGGGHSVAGKALCDGGIVIDMRQMNGVSIDERAKTATVGGGCTMSHLDRGTQPYGLMTTGGRVSTTGVGGFTLGGGSGWLDRKFGLGCDNLLSVELVTAEGDVVRASENEHPDLFWALHGGGGNFGVATSLTFRLFELSSVTVALLLWRPDAGPDVLKVYTDFMNSAPDSVGGGAIYLTGPSAVFVPQHLVGKLALALLLVYAGPESEARKVLAPVLNLKHEGEMISEMPYADFQCMLDDPPGFRNYWSVEYLDAFPEKAASLFCKRANDMIVPSPSQHVLFPQGGAVGRDHAQYPIPWRKARWCVHPFGLWENPADDQNAKRWSDNLRADLKPWSSGAVYLNFIGDEGADRVIAGFGRENYSRLAKIKKQYDPNNVFHINHNIKPA